MIKDEFTPEIIEKLKYYVYRLIDPRNGQTFYVGKGCGNRIFQHVKQMISYYDGAEQTLESDPNKLKIIRDIVDGGLDVIHVIQRWGLTEKEALEVEAALIDAYQGLSNIQRGFQSDEYGVTNAKTLIKLLSRKTYEEPHHFKYIIVKVQQWRLDELYALHNINARYEATRGGWRIRPRDVNEYPYAFSVTGGIVREVYQIDKWFLTDVPGRYAFEGHIADDSIRNQVIDMRIPDVYTKKGMASPVLFSKNIV